MRWASERSTCPSSAISGLDGSVMAILRRPKDFRRSRIQVFKGSRKPPMERVMTASSRFLPVLVAGLAPLAAGTAAGDSFTRQFPIASCNFKATGGNANFNLTPGRQLYLSNLRCVQDGDCDELDELWITMLPETKEITFDYAGKPRTVRARVMEEYETVDSELEEVS